LLLLPMLLSAAAAAAARAFASSHVDFVVVIYLVPEGSRLGLIQ
jgi:ABC-type Fe3+ transport system permease subunit